MQTSVSSVSTLIFRLVVLRSLLFVTGCFLFSVKFGDRWRRRTTVNVKADKTPEACRLTVKMNDCQRRDRCDTGRVRRETLGSI
ncbi:hypothetical protein MHYP_G00258840 [Metynnis hypsauchen]